MLVSIPPDISVSQFMGYLKGKSSLMIFDRHVVMIKRIKLITNPCFCNHFFVDKI